MRCNVDGSMSTNGAEEDFEPISRPSKGIETTTTDKHVQSQTEIQAAEQVHDETRATPVSYTHLTLPTNREV